MWLHTVCNLSLLEFSFTFKFNLDVRFRCEAYTWLNSCYVHTLVTYNNDIFRRLSAFINVQKRSMVVTCDGPCILLMGNVNKVNRTLLRVNVAFIIFIESRLFKTNILAL